MPARMPLYRTSEWEMSEMGFLCGQRVSSESGPTLSSATYPMKLRAILRALRARRCSSSAKTSGAYPGVLFPRGGVRSAGHAAGTSRTTRSGGLSAAQLSRPSSMFTLGASRRALSQGVRARSPLLRRAHTAALDPSISGYATKLAETQPCFAASSSSIRIMQQPTEFYQCLLVGTFLSFGRHLTMLGL